MQVFVLLLLPVLATGTSFEVCNGRDVALLHDSRQHVACCRHHECEVSPEAHTCQCSRHHHEQIHWLMDIGARSERLFVETLATVRPMALSVMLLSGQRGTVVIMSAPTDRKLSPMSCCLLPLIC